MNPHYKANPLQSSTLYWHDFETWGEVPAADKPSQFAGVRTDEALNIVGDPLCLYCQPAPDYVPKPEACLVTGISPQKALAEGVSEREFIAAIHAELAAPGTCGVGYNSLRFDDEVTRYTLYRNFYDPYQREWQHGNSRWDIIDMVRLTYALRPDGIEWPTHDDGSPSFKLEQLTAANGLSHAAAHDALSDVYATIDLAKLIKQRQPQLYDYVYQHRRKKAVQALIDVPQRKPLLHISSMFPATQGCAALVAPLAYHPTNSNGVIAFDLRQDPAPLEHLSVEEIQYRLFTRRDELPDDVERLPLKVIHVNKSPIVLPAKMLDSATATRLGFDTEQQYRHWQTLASMDLGEKLQQVFAQRPAHDSQQDPETMLYQGFLPNVDKPLLDEVRNSSPHELNAEHFPFTDTRMAELLFRYKARNFPESLIPSEQQRWQQECLQRLSERPLAGGITVSEMHARITDLRQERDLTVAQEALLTNLAAYAESLLAQAKA